MSYEKPNLYTPRVIIHGGAGNITRQNLPPALWHQHQQSLLSILHSTDALLKDCAADALTAAVHAVSLFEQNPLYNAGVGAVFTRTGTIELEASVMVSHGRRKRGAAVSLLKHVKYPIQLAASILNKGEEDNAGGAQGHVHLSGPAVEELASAWGLEMCEESHFWTRKRWEEHRRGLDEGKTSHGVSLLDYDDRWDNTVALRPDGTLWPHDDPSWNGKDYLPQGTVGCVVMDRHGVIAVATSTGGITNKLPGRIGDTPTFGAGFWAEQAHTDQPTHRSDRAAGNRSVSGLPIHLDLPAFIRDCFPQLSSSTYTANDTGLHSDKTSLARSTMGMSGTGNGDSFLRLCAVRTTAAIAQFSSSDQPIPLQDAVSQVAGPGGLLEQSAGDCWGITGEGEGGIIGIGYANSRSSVVFDFNCGGLFRAWIDEQGESRCEVFHASY